MKGSDKETGATEEVVTCAKGIEMVRVFHVEFTMGGESFLRRNREGSGWNH